METTRRPRTELRAPLMGRSSPQPGLEVQAVQGPAWRDIPQVWALLRPLGGILELP